MFHVGQQCYTGVSAKKGTKGVPRMKELINIAKNIKAPGLNLNDSELHILTNAIEQGFRSI